jgi:hypothetical protein
VNSVFVAVRTELFEFKSGRGIATVFSGGIARYARSALIVISTTLGAFYRDGDTDAFFTGHSLKEI